MRSKHINDKRNNTICRENEVKRKMEMLRRK